MLKRSENPRPAASCGCLAEDGTRREDEGEVAGPKSGWLDVGHAAAFTQSNSGPRWSPDRDDILRELVDAGAPIDVICSRLRCSCDAVRTRVLMLRLGVRSPD